MAQCHQEVLCPVGKDRTDLSQIHTKAQCQQEVPSPVGKDRMDLSHNVIKRYSVMLVQTLKQYWSVTQQSSVICWELFKQSGSVKHNIAPRAGTQYCWYRHSHHRLILNTAGFCFVSVLNFQTQYYTLGLVPVQGSKGHSPHHHGTIIHKLSSYIRW